VQSRVASVKSIISSKGLAVARASLQAAPGSTTDGRANYLLKEALNNAGASGLQQEIGRLLNLQP